MSRGLTMGKNNGLPHTSTAWVKLPMHHVMMYEIIDV